MGGGGRERERKRGEGEEGGRGRGRSSLVLMSSPLPGSITCNIKLKIIAFCEFLKVILH